MTENNDNKDNNIIKNNIEIKLKQILKDANVKDYIYNKAPIIFDNGKNWWAWDFKKRKWIIIDETDVIIKIDDLKVLEEEIHKQYVKRELLNLISMIARRKFNSLKDINEIGKEFSKKNLGVVCFKNCIKKIGVEQSFDLTSEYFIKSTIPYNYINGCVDEIKTPEFDKLAVDWVGEDNKLILYQLIGYCMIEGYPLGHLFCLIGGGRNGKSKFLECIEKIIGLDNIVATSLDGIISNRFKVAQLCGKLVAVMGETNFSTLKDTDVLKRLTSGDSGDLIDAEFKGKDSFKFKNNAKILIATNNLPMTTDRSDGFYSRWIIIDFPNQFPEMPGLLAKISDYEWELLANKAYREIEKVILKGKFHNQGTIEDRKKKFEEKSNPLIPFIETYCKKDVNGMIPIYQFHDRLMIYFEQRNYRKVSKAAISDMMVNNFGFEKEKEYITINNEKKNYWCYIGIKWKNENEIELPDIDIENRLFNKEQIIEKLKKELIIDIGLNDDQIIKLYQNNGQICEIKNGIYKYIKGK